MKRRLFSVGYFLVLTVFTVYVLLDTFVITRVYTRVEEAPGTGTVSEDNGSVTGAEQDGGTSNDINNDSDGNASGRTENGSDGSTSNALGGNALNGTDSGTSNEAGGGSDDSASNGAGDSDDSTAGTAEKAVVTDTSYRDGNIQISITEYRELDTTIYAADLMLADAGYLKTALAQDSYGRNVTEKTSVMAAEKNAILAINGDYYGVQENGYVLRNGVLYRDTAGQSREDLVIYQDGSFEIIEEDEISAQTLLDHGASQILSFGPALVEDGEITISQDDEVGKAMTSNPRTAIAWMGDLHYLFLVSDGRTKENAGLSLYELASFAQQLGAQTVYNLDGGGSSTMYFNGNVINQPTTSGKIHERSVSDIVYIGY